MTEQYNQIISEWRGECRHTGLEGYFDTTGTDVKINCNNCGLSWVNRDVTPPDYSTLTAWDDKLYGEIEEKVLLKIFVKHLHGLVYNIASDGCLYSLTRHLWEYAKASPEAKAIALAKAIKESQ